MLKSSEIIWNQLNRQDIDRTSPISQCTERLNHVEPVACPSMKWLVGPSSEAFHQHVCRHSSRQDWGFRMANKCDKCDTSSGDNWWTVKHCGPGTETKAPALRQTSQEPQVYAHLCPATTPLHNRTLGWLTSKIRNRKLCGIIIMMMMMIIIIIISFEWPSREAS